MNELAVRGQISYLPDSDTVVFNWRGSLITCHTRDELWSLLRDLVSEEHDARLEERRAKPLEIVTESPEEFFARGGTVKRIRRGRQPIDLGQFDLTGLTPLDGGHHDPS